MSTVSAGDIVCTPRRLMNLLPDVIEGGRVPFLKGPPSSAKSAVAKMIAKKYNLFMIDHRLSTSAPEDMTGLPRFTDDGKAIFAPFEGLFPLEDTPVPEGYKGWLIFLDEFNSCDESIQAAAYKLVLDRMTGQHKLNPRVVIMAAGNREEDRAIVNSLGTAMQSRVLTFKVELSFREWVEDFAIPHGIDPRIIAFLEYDQGNFDTFRPDHNDETFACARTYEFLHDTITDLEGNPRPVSIEKIPTYVAAIGPIGAEFAAFCEVENDLIKIDDIVADPDRVDIPTDRKAQWVTMSYLARNVDKDTIDSVVTYVNRFSALDQRVLFYRMIWAHKPELGRSQAMIRGSVAVDAYLNQSSNNHTPVTRAEALVGAA